MLEMVDFVMCDIPSQTTENETETENVTPVVSRVSVFNEKMFKTKRQFGMYMYILIHTHTLYIHILKHTHTHTYTCSYIHILIHTHTHT